MLVPHRPDGGHRDALWAWTEAKWARDHPEIPYFTSTGPLTGLFNRSAAINSAAEAAGDWDVAVIGDSDSFTEGNQVDQAIALASETQQMVIAHDHWRRLRRAGTKRIMEGYLGCWEPFVEFDLHNTVSSMITMPRALWEAVRGFDPGFVGWGFEDLAFHASCDRLGGGTGRIKGPVWHLWHPKPDASKTREYRAALERMHRYCACETAAEMRALIKELRA